LVLAQARIILQTVQLRDPCRVARCGARMFGERKRFMIRRTIHLLLTLVLTLHVASASAAGISVVAAENFYGDVASQIGGDAVAVTSVITNPDQDPHLLETSPSVARLVASARIVILNGMDYDPWMSALLSGSHVAARRVIVASSLVGGKPGQNPHIWFDLATMLAVAKATAIALAAIEPARQAFFAARLATFESSLRPIQARIAFLRQRLQGIEVTSTEPVFGNLFASLGLVSRDMAFQLATMNDTEASVSEVAAFEDDLRARRVKLLIYNEQAQSPVSEQMRSIAVAAGVPVVAVSETEPRGTTYQAWMSKELDAVQAALDRGQR
jgi:zinc/manganese transport system substrate-binding protein